MKEDYFQDALSNFTFDVASGGALYESGEYHGTAWFTKLSEKVIF